MSDVSISAIIDTNVALAVRRTKTAPITHITPDNRPFIVPNSSEGRDRPDYPAFFVSTTFHAALTFGSRSPDIILISRDNVFFHVHVSQLTSTSLNGFGSLVNAEIIACARDYPPAVVMVPEDAVLLNVLLHCVYDMPCDQYEPSLGVLLDTINAFKTYGIPAQRFVAPCTIFYNHVLSQSPRSPLDVFIVAAENELEPLAIATSARLHSLRLSDITDHMAKRIGPVYLKRLLTLHLERTERLKALLTTAPKSHPDTLECGFVEQKQLTRAWALAAASLIWDIRPGGL